MNILLSADFHSDFSRLVHFAKRADLCICCGDIFDYHKLPERKFKFPLPFFSIKGNKELWGGVLLHKKIADYGNFFWLNENLDQLEEITGLHFYGIDHTLEPTTIPFDIDVLISHQPAYGLADQCSDPFHAKMVPHCGSKSLRKLIDIYRPKFLVSGHVHHSQQRSNGKTQAITLPPALIEPVFILRIEKGKITVKELKN
ncbi:MAG: metallophosphoesterase [Candidatus Hodarchaeota archaeon]